jgi:hypothetical protein
MFFSFLLLYWYQDTLGVNMIFRGQMKSMLMLDVFFLPLLIKSEKYYVS